MSVELSARPGSPQAPEEGTVSAWRPGTSRRRRLALILAIVGVLAASGLSLAVGSRTIELTTVWQALFGSATGPDAQVITTLRLPRTVLGLLAGTALGVAGALIQAVTRNPLADPGILGVNAGSAFAIAIAVGVFGVTSPSGYLWFALLGALLATVAVYVIGSSGHGSVSPARITLAGMALGAVLSGITSALRLADDKKFSVIQTWQAGSFADRGWDVIVPTLPFLAVGLILAVVLRRSLDAIALSDDMARALGTNVTAARLGALAAITLLAGGATAMVGPIVFVGLMVPHVARWVAGPRQGWIIGLSALLAPVLVLVSDVIGRVILRPEEVAVSVVTAFIGAPVLIHLVRHSKASAL